MSDPSADFARSSPQIRLSAFTTVEGGFTVAGDGYAALFDRARVLLAASFVVSHPWNVFVALTNKLVFPPKKCCPFLARPLGVQLLP